MEKKKYILGIIVSILVISIGVSFAYFATRTLLTGNGTNTQGTTVSLGDTTVNIEGSPDFSDTNIYPGHKTVSRVKVTATGDKNVIYHLIWNGQNNLKTTLNYTVYKTTTEENPSITCEKKEEGNITKIFYETCTESNFTNLGEIISSGEITPTTDETTFKLVKNEEIQATNTGAIVYYYIILEYPNKEESQNIDMNGTFIGTTIIELLEKKAIGGELIIANNTIDTSRASGPFNGIYTENTARKIFSAEDDDGETYFFAGSSPNNWVSFARYYWRIIRINGDGSIRLIYNGPTTVQTGQTTEIGVSAFNEKYDDNAYVGYMYGTVDSWKDGGQSSSTSLVMILEQYYYGTEYQFNTETGLYSLSGIKTQGTWNESFASQVAGQYTCRSTSATGTCKTLYKIESYLNVSYAYAYSFNIVSANTTTYAETHTNTNSSTIKNYLDNWYSRYLKENYEQYIDTNAGFCGDRTVDNYSDGYIGDGSGATLTQYAPSKRVYNTYTPTYKCSNQANDLYTLTTSNKGNKALENPIGLITSDEVMYAGGYEYVSGATYNHWLNTEEIYWTMSPSSFHGSFAYVPLVSYDGYIGDNGNVNSRYGVRPVINLKADTLKFGSGTTSDPYRIAE